jgi:hypothetical protein
MDCAIIFNYCVRCRFAVFLLNLGPDLHIVLFAYHRAGVGFQKDWPVDIYIIYICITAFIIIFSLFCCLATPNLCKSTIPATTVICTAPGQLGASAYEV